MARKAREGTAATVPASTPTLKKSSSTTQSSRNQKSILGFFQSRTPTAKSPSLPVVETASSAQKASRSSPRYRKSTGQHATSQDLTPAPSSDAPDGEDDRAQHSKGTAESEQLNGLPSPDTSANGDVKGKAAEDGPELTNFGTPSRRAKKFTSYAEPESDTDPEDDDDVFKPKPKRRIVPALKRRKISASPEADTYEQNDGSSIGDDDDDLDGFIASNDSDEDVQRPKKRKRISNTSSRKPSHAPLSEMQDETDLDFASTSVSTAKQWSYDPANPQALKPRPVNVPSKQPHGNATKRKEKAHTREPEERYTWLADIRDIDRNPPGHPDYDPRTLYIPPLAWKNFSPFEKQYWEIKQKFWDSIVFFKKGKFYELYENDATIGHQLFDLKLTDRVNMRMVGVPEMSLDMWANQFVAKGFKIARVDQQETALGKDMRERDQKASASGGIKGAAKDKVIKRELACVLTAGTLVEGSMLQDDMSTYCVAIKESTSDDLPAFGVSFVDTATGQFHLTQFVDDADLTKFETFVAQTRPQELLLEKGEISVRALRILKNNTGPTTLWNYLKPGKEFWEAHITRKELEANDYFGGSWPDILEHGKEKELLMSSFGALMQYLRLLKIENDLMTLGNFNWYDPIKKATSLVLDGQTLINLEVFANSFDGGPDGTLFQLLNRCITPFGKRTFKQWVCHPLMDVVKINARLDAVDSLNADTAVRDRFTANLSKLPDLERLISRVHAGSVKALDFVRVLEGFEQIDYTISLLRDGRSKSVDGEGVIGQLVSAMPDLESRLTYWKTAFDREKAKDNSILVPERGIEGDFDESQDIIESVHEELNDLLAQWQKKLGSKAICYRDNGKEIFQLEVPVKVKNIPKGWDQMSATKQVKRYYFSELRSLVRKLQEAQETHSQIVKEVASRLYKRFDEDYDIWLAAVKLIAQLDCLISLAKASCSLGQPSCRPNFVDSDRSVLDLQDLRHPCLLRNVDDFIPNDICLGGEHPSLNLLTGANAAGKSTVLRMTCTAVLMAQIGCYLPCANDHIFAAQSTFFVELAETGKILKEATPRSLVILDELGRGTSSHDGLAVAQAVLWDLAGRVGCLGVFATHYHSLATDFEQHPEVKPMRMKILVDEEERRVTFLYKLEEGVAEGSFGMHCASMCGISRGVVERAEVVAEEREVGKVKSTESTDALQLGLLSDLSYLIRDDEENSADDEAHEKAEEVDCKLSILRKGIEKL
ncbi:MAG: hypothetical protein Q9160_004412 [Pyrenula sp. 1 TL-2023]